MAPGGEMFRYPQHFGENVLPHGSHEWLPYSKDEVRLKTVNNNLSSGPGGGRKRGLPKGCFPGNGEAGGCAGEWRVV